MSCKKCNKKEYCSGFCEECFIQYFEKKVKYTIRKFSLLGKKEKIAVAVSGGKDSTVLMYLLHKFGYDIIGLTVNAYIGNYSKESVVNLKKVCDKYSIPLQEISVRKEFGHSVCYIQGILKQKGCEMQSCAVCGVLRRYLLNKHSKGFDVICTGHNMDDEAQAFLMNVFRNDTKQVYRGGPKTLGKGFVPRVKPLYLMKEKEIELYSKAMKFPVKYESCPCSTEAYRKNFLRFLNEFEKKHVNVKDNIVAFYLTEYWGKASATKPNTCKTCGEPASKNECKACEIIAKLVA